METKQTISKGELMEELLRNYFLNSGYYVVRGVKYQYENLDITDVDLYLYGRSSSLARHRVNVDIKNKKSPQAFERILWANGLRELLDFDSCIVATTDQRPIIHSFGQKHNTIVLDGTFLSKLKPTSSTERLTEEELLNKISKYKSYRSYKDKNWRFIYEKSKSKLLSEQDFSGFNEELSFLKYFIEKTFVDDQKRDDAIRMTYLILSHMLITIDFILKDIAFLDSKEKEKKLSDGFKFGNLGKNGVDKIISIAVEISGNKSANSFLKAFENIPTDILKDFFSKNENSRNLFNWAKEFERLGYNRQFINPEKIESPLKGTLSVMLDFFRIERKKYFDLFPLFTQTSIQLGDKDETLKE